MVTEGEVLWRPSTDFVERSNLVAFMRWLNSHGLVDAKDYEELRVWSVAEPEAFWKAVWDYFGVDYSGSYEKVLSSREMPGAAWFAGAKVNYAEHLLRAETASSPIRVAIHHLTESRPLSAISWSELGRKIRVLATRLREMGVCPGDRVVSYMPNIPETAIAMIATLAIGAVWSSAAPEFGIKTVIDRFSQIAPKVLFAADGYFYGGKSISRIAEAKQIVDQLPSLETVIWVPYLASSHTLPEIRAVARWSDVMSGPDVSREQFRFERVDQDHPLWIVFSSGTTGLPKPIVHGHTGMLLEHLKFMHFHANLTPESTMFFYSTTGWMMWNLLISALLAGSSIVLYDGHPTYPLPTNLWKLASETGTTCFGASPTFIQMMEKAGAAPGKEFDLSKIETVFVSGAPSTPETFAWLYGSVKRDLWVTSQSGGSELCSGLVGGVPTLPVYAGRIQSRLLGMDVHCWDDAGNDITGRVGELVVTTPAPSMPIFFWNDRDMCRYRNSYFDVYPGVWRHGDFITIYEDGSCYINGRSDATLNRFGVRIGTAEIYRAVEKVSGIADSIIVCCELPSGNFFMPLFVALTPGTSLDKTLEAAIKEQLRQDCSPRHLPDRIYQVPDIPYTLTGKKLEVPVRKILMGAPIDRAASRDALSNPTALDFFAHFAAESTDYSWRA